MNIMGLTGFDNNIQRMWQIAKDRAAGAIGVPVFDFQPSVIQKALVADMILDALDGQDEDDARVRQLLGLLHAANEAVFAPVDVNA